jgi:hypothetical protein
VYRFLYCFLSGLGTEGPTTTAELVTTTPRNCIKHSVKEHHNRAFPRAKTCPPPPPPPPPPLQRARIVARVLENKIIRASCAWIIMLRLFQKLLTDKELTPPDDWDPPIGYSRNTWANIVHNKVRIYHP